MKRKILFVLIILAFLAMNACHLVSTSPQILLKTEFNGEGIAVLNFAKQNSSMMSDLGKLAADKLTDALFLEAKFNVIDRSVVNDAALTMSINSTELLSVEALQKFGKSINANFLILGRIQYFSKQEFLNSDDEKQLYISFRIISVSTGEVVGVGTYKNSFSDDLIEEINSAMYTVVREMI